MINPVIYKNFRTGKILCNEKYWNKIKHGNVALRQKLNW